MFQRVNHFPNNKELCRKDNLKKHLDKYIMLRGYKHAYQFRIMPQTFVLPHEYLAFVECFTKDGGKAAKNNVWSTNLSPALCLQLALLTRFRIPVNTTGCESREKVRAPRLA